MIFEMIIVLDTLSQTGQPSDPLVDFRKPRRVFSEVARGNWNETLWMFKQTWRS